MSLTYLNGNGSVTPLVQPTALLDGLQLTSHVSQPLLPIINGSVTLTHTTDHLWQSLHSYLYFLIVLQITATRL
jgi:hypothetical protein